MFILFLESTCNICYNDKEKIGTRLGFKQYDVILTKEE